MYWRRYFEQKTHYSSRADPSGECFDSDSIYTNRMRNILFFSTNRLSDIHSIVANNKSNFLSPLLNLTVVLPFTCVLILFIGFSEMFRRTVPKRKRMYNTVFLSAVLQHMQSVSSRYSIFYRDVPR